MVKFDWPDTIDTQTRPDTAAGAPPLFVTLAQRFTRVGAFSDRALRMEINELGLSQCPLGFYSSPYQESRPVPAVPAGKAAAVRPPVVDTPRSAQENPRTMASRPFIPGWPYHDASAAFRAWNERRRMQGAVLCAVIGCIDERLIASRDRPDGSLPTAREVWLEIDPAQLGRTKRPRLRAVQAQLRCSRIDRLGIQAANRWAKRRSGYPGRAHRRVRGQRK